MQSDSFRAFILPLYVVAKNGAVTSVSRIVCDVNIYFLFGFNCQTFKNDIKIRFFFLSEVTNWLIHSVQIDCDSAQALVVWLSASSQE